MSNQISDRILEINHQIIGAAIQIHRVMGPGRLESVYQLCMEEEFESRGLRYQAKVPLDMQYGKRLMKRAFFADFVVEDEVVVELKSARLRPPSAVPQVLTYLTFAELDVGLILNFGRETMKSGIRRVIKGGRVIEGLEFVDGLPVFNPEKED